MNVIKYINEYLEEMAETKSEQTVKGHRSSLMQFAKAVDAEEPIEVLVKDVVRFRNEQYEQKKAGTVNTMIKRIKKFFSWCEEKGYVDISPATDVKLLTEGEQLPKWLDEEQEDFLVKLVKKKYLGTEAKRKTYRQPTMIMLMLKAGLRVGEVSNLKWEEIQIVGDKGKALIRGKGQQQRTVPLIPDVVEYLKKYREETDGTGYVFSSRNGDPVTERSIQKVVAQFKGASNKRVNLNELHPHVLRHTFAHNLAKAGMQLEAIARVLGHMKKDGTPNIKQTIRYTKASENEIADDLERILSLR
jgi:site-specific recombinase XerD